MLSGQLQRTGGPQCRSGDPSLFSSTSRNNKAKAPTMNDAITSPQVTDPHGLLATGEELATAPELAKLLGVSTTVLRGLLGGRLYSLVRFVRYTPGASRYSVADARQAIEPHRPDIEARRLRAEEHAAKERAAKAAKDAAKAAKKGKGRTPPPKG